MGDHRGSNDIYERGQFRMKKQKTVVPFYFKDMTNQQMVDHLNDNYPISLRHNEDLVNRVYARYPILDKSEVGIIVKAVFASFRDLLILGKILNFNSLFFDTKLHFFDHRRDGRILPSLKVRMSTPPKLRKHGK
jgi:hypothetical protein